MFFVSGLFLFLIHSLPIFEILVDSPMNRLTLPSQLPTVVFQVVMNDLWEFHATLRDEMVLHSVGYRSKSDPWMLDSWNQFASPRFIWIGPKLFRAIGIFQRFQRGPEIGID